jgi:fucose 4-O-acetylase-like acetyltransferase
MKKVDICEQIINMRDSSIVRNERIDSVKYWLMVLVIAGHVLMYDTNTKASVVTWKWIYIFHMPLFIFFSGYFSRKKEKADVSAFIWKLLEPLIVFQVLTLLPRFFFESFSLITILTPWTVLWYFLSLIYWRLMIQIIPSRFLNNSRLIMISSFCISILVGLLPFDTLLSLQRTFAFMPFFFLGYCMRGRNLFFAERYKPLSLAFLILTFSIPILIPQYLGDIFHAYPYDNYYYAVSRILLFFISIPISLAFLNICPNTSWIAQQGKLTMQYLIYHALLIPPFMVVVSKLNIPMSFTTAIIYTLIITGGIGFASRLPLFKKLTNPSSLLKK